MVCCSGLTCVACLESSRHDGLLFCSMFGAAQWFGNYRLSRLWCSDGQSWVMMVYLELSRHDGSLFCSMVQVAQWFSAPMSCDTSWSRTGGSSWPTSRFKVGLNFAVTPQSLPIDDLITAT